MLIYILGPFLYTVIDYTFVQELSPRFWDFGLALYQMILAAVLLLIAWFKPFIGGILMLILGAIILLIGMLSIASGPEMGGYAWIEFFKWAIPLLILGYLFFKYGRGHTKTQNE
jgi:hypothetical protein